MNIIFLDVDGVLNTTKSNELMWYHKIYSYDKYKINKMDSNGNIIQIFDNDLIFNKPFVGEGVLNIACILRLKHIIDNVDNLRIVMSSYWRLSPWKMSSLKYYLKMYGINPDIIIDCTPRMTFSRATEILYWVEHNNHIKNWIAIDDMYLNLEKNHYVQTDPDIGLTDENVEEIIKMFY